MECWLEMSFQGEEVNPSFRREPAMVSSGHLDRSWVTWEESFSDCLCHVGLWTLLRAIVLIVY